MICTCLVWLFFFFFVQSVFCVWKDLFSKHYLRYHNHWSLPLLILLHYIDVMPRSTNILWVQFGVLLWQTLKFIVFKSIYTSLFLVFSTLYLCFLANNISLGDFFQKSQNIFNIFFVTSPSYAIFHKLQCILSDMDSHRLLAPGKGWKLEMHHNVKAACIKLYMGCRWGMTGYRISVLHLMYFDRNFCILEPGRTEFFFLKLCQKPLSSSHSHTIAK